MCRFSKLLLSFFCKDGSDWLKKKKTSRFLMLNFPLHCACCWFLEGSLVSLVVVAILSGNFLFIVMHALVCAHAHTHAHSFVQIFLWHTHTHTHTPVCMRPHGHAASPPHLFLSLSLPEVLRILLLSSMLQQTWLGVQPQSCSSFSPGISFVTKCSATPNWEK